MSYCKVDNFYLDYLLKRSDCQYRTYFLSIVILVLHYTLKKCRINNYNERISHYLLASQSKIGVVPITPWWILTDGVTAAAQTWDSGVRTASLSLSLALSLSLSLSLSWEASLPPGDGVTEWQQQGRTVSIMCEADTVQYLRDLCQEKEYLDTLDGHTVIKTLLEQGEATLFIKPCLLLFTS